MVLSPFVSTLMGRETRILMGLLGLLAGLFVGVLSLKLLVPRPPAGAGPDVHGDVAFQVPQEIVDPPAPGPRLWGAGVAPPALVATVVPLPADESPQAGPLPAVAFPPEASHTPDRLGVPPDMTVDPPAAIDRAAAGVSADPFVSSAAWHRPDAAEDSSADVVPTSRFTRVETDVSDTSSPPAFGDDPAAPAVRGWPDPRPDPPAFAAGRYEQEMPAFSQAPDEAAAPAEQTGPAAVAPTFSPPLAAVAPAVVAGPIEGSHVVTTGDSWWSLAERAYGDGRLYRALFAWNRALDPRIALAPGTSLQVPPREQLEAAWPRLMPTGR
jgi:hypothetical protein